MNMNSAAILAILLAGPANFACSVSAKLLGNTSPSSQPEAKASGSRPDGQSRSDASHALAATSSRTPLSGGNASNGPRAESSDLVGYLHDGATSYHNGRLHFDAYVAGLPTSTTPPSVELRRKGKVLGAVTMRPSKDWKTVFVCDGAVADTSSNKVSYYDDCSFPGDLQAGTYQLAIVMDGGEEVAEQSIEIASSHEAGGESSLIVGPSARAGTGKVNTVATTFWHTVDLRDQVEKLQFVWMKGNQIVASGYDLARGHRLWHDKSPLVDVVPVRGPAPSVKWGASSEDLRLLVFKEGKHLVGRMQLEVVHTTGEIGKVGALVPTDDVTDEQLRAAKKLALELSGKGGTGVQGINMEWPESVVCAVVRSPDAMAALRDWVGGINGAGFSNQDARTSDAKSKQEWRSNASRRKHKESANDSREGAAVGKSQAKDADAALRRFAGKYKAGCLASLGPVTDS